MKNTHERSGRADARPADVMKVLAGARPDELDPARLTDTPRQREDLARILATGATDDRAARLRTSRRLRPLGAAAALAAVAASAVVVSTLDGDPAGGRAGGPTHSTSAAADPGSSTSNGATDVSVDGRLELLGVARKAETPAAEGTYWQTTSRSQNVEVVKAAGGQGQPFAVRTTSTEEWSVGVRPGTRSLMVSGLDATTEPRTRADENRWRSAGSPATMQAEVPGNDGGGRLGYTMGTRRPMVMRTDADDKVYALGPQNITYQDLLELPADVTELRRKLERLYADDSGADTGAGRAAYVLRQAADLVTMPVKPAVRAAAYRVMAELPGVRGLGRVTDPLGREGAGFTFPGTDPTPLGSVRQRLVVDASTGELLCEQLVLVEPSAMARKAGLDAGTTVNYTATTRMGWGEKQITVPKNARH
ncbi:CU044_5270 family protein [Streptomyces kunmingensis]|uniref:CU044_5270 family protein n=1 Tax=Streptomyces kunmingensis TaxID=68225 RepID=A0ABU6C7D1_9ACTN|nr:CU044_5270 family protein [Streptomyces kunmingensis]MEB3960618.1 CU044_5270 family protein [Streptomyces kunmingensis]